MYNLRGMFQAAVLLSAIQAAALKSCPELVNIDKGRYENMRMSCYNSPAGPLTICNEAHYSSVYTSDFESCMKYCVAASGCLGVVRPVGGGGGRGTCYFCNSWTGLGIGQSYEDIAWKDTCSSAVSPYNMTFDYGCGGRISGTTISTLWTPTFLGCMALCDQSIHCDAANFHEGTRYCTLMQRPSAPVSENTYMNLNNVNDWAVRKAPPTDPLPPRTTTTTVHPLPSSTNSCSCYVNEYYDPTPLVPPPTYSPTPCTYTQTAVPVAVGEEVYEYGCLQNTTAGKTFPNPTTDKTNTPMSCNARCLSLGYLISGTAKGYACACYQLQNLPKSPLLPGADCSVPCTGNSSLHCGGKSEQVSFLVNPVPGIFCPDPPLSSCKLEINNTQVPPSGYKFGCYENLKNGYDLDPELGMSPGACNNRCLKLGMSVSGTSNGTLCTCFDGSYLPKRYRLSEHYCDSPCEGDANQTCGGSLPNLRYDLVVNTSPHFCPRQPLMNCTLQNTADLVPPTGLKFGCFEDIEGGYKLPVQNTNTPANCNVRCVAAKYGLSATYQGNMCVCYHEKSLPLQRRLPDSACNNPCVYNKTEMCGGAAPNVTLSVVVNVDSDYCPLQPPVTVCPTNETATAVGDSESAFKFGCYENVPFSVRLDNDTTSNTPATCHSRCLELGYSISGTYNGVGCACYPLTSLPLQVRAAETYCNVACSGDSAQKCGAAHPRSIVSLVVNTGADFCPVPPIITKL